MLSSMKELSFPETSFRFQLFVLAVELAIFACCAFTHGLMPWLFEYELVDWTIEYILVLKECIARIGGASDAGWESRLAVKFDESKPAAPGAWLGLFHYMTRDSFDDVYKRDMRLVEAMRADVGYFKYHLVEAKFLKATHDDYVIFESAPGTGAHARRVDTDKQLAGYERMRDAGELADACTFSFYYSHLLITLGGVTRLIRTSRQLFGLALRPRMATDADTLATMVSEHTAFLANIWVAFPGLQTWDRVRFTDEIVHA